MRHHGNYHVDCCDFLLSGGMRHREFRLEDGSRTDDWAQSLTSLDVEGSVKFATTLTSRREEPGRGHQL